MARDSKVELRNTDDPLTLKDTDGTEAPTGVAKDVGFWVLGNVAF